LFCVAILANQTKLDEMDEWFNWAPKVLHYDPALKSVSQKIRDFYFGTNVKHLNSGEMIQNVITLFGDRFFNLGKRKKYKRLYLLFDLKNLKIYCDSYRYNTISNFREEICPHISLPI
jgi:hypothetical protein